MARGLSPFAIRAEWRGEADLVASANARDPASRRVVVTFTFQ